MKKFISNINRSERTQNKQKIRACKFLLLAAAFALLAALCISPAAAAEGQTEISTSEAFAAIKMQGNYILTNNITLSTQWSAPTGTTYLDLNGHWIKQTSSDSRVIFVNSGRELIISDSNPTAVHSYHVDGDLWVLDYPFVSSNPKLFGGVITGGKATRSIGVAPGGGVHINGGSVTMNGGNIIGNTASLSGGGVEVYDDGLFTANGVNIAGNTAKNSGGGVHIDGTFTVSGNTIIKDNVVGEVANNVYLPNGRKITLGGALGESSHIGVGTATASGLLSPVEITVVSEFASASKTHFFADKYEEEIACTDNILSLAKRGGNWNGPGLPNEAGDYTLTKDITLTDEWTAPPGTTYLDLNGHYIKQETPGKRVMSVRKGADLHIIDKDRNALHSFSEDEYGVWVLDDTFDSSHLVVYGGVITGGNDLDYGKGGGGVYVYEGKFTLDAGNIVGNTAAGYGGGVYIGGYGGAFTMKGGNITGNSANSGGGGVHYQYGSFNLRGGSITHNIADDNGGGVLAYDSAVMSGDVIVKDNTVKGAGNNYYMYDIRKIVLDADGLGEKANIGISVPVENAPTPGNPVTIIESGVTVDAASHFFADNDEEKIIFEDPSLKLATVWEIWTHTDYLPNNNPVTDGNYYILNDNVTLTDKWSLTEGVPTHLDLNGHWIKQTNTDQRVIELKTGAELFIKDSKPEATHSFHQGANGVWVLDETFNPDNHIVYGGLITGGTAPRGRPSTGGGIFDHGMLTMTGGTLIGNIAECGAGLYNTGKAYLSGVKIIKNNASIYAGGMYNGGECVMNDVTVTENTADGYSGGLHLFAGSCTISGDIIIDDNSVSGVENNVNLSLGEKMRPSSKYFTLGEDGLGTNSRIGVMSEETPEYGKPIKIIKSGATAEAAAHFFPDKPDTEKILLEGDVLNLRLIPANPRISSASLALGTDIAVRFKVPKASMGGYTNPQILATFNETLYTLNPVTEGDDYVFTFRNISPSEMALNIDAELFATEEGTTVATKHQTMTYSVKDYCLHMLDEPESSTELKKLCVDLLYYGSAAQEYLGEDDSAKLANNYLTDDQKELRNKTTPVSRYSAEISSEGSDRLLKWTYGSLNLYSNISVVARFETTASLGSIRAEIKYGEPGKEKTEYINNLDSNCITFNKLNALELNYPIEIVIILKTDGNFKSKKLTYGADAYYAYAKGQTSDPELQNIVLYMMRYIRSVEEYVTVSS